MKMGSIRRWITQGWGHLVALAVAVSLVYGFPTEALALDATAPLTSVDGVIACPTCTSASSTITDKAIVYGTGGARALTGVAPNGTTTRQFLSQESDVASGAPALGVILQADLPAETSAQVSTRVSDETGSGALVFGTAPAIAGVTGTGTWGLTGATVNLPAAAVDAITEIAAAIKTGGGSKLATADGALVSGNFAAFDADGDVVDSGVAASGGGAKPILIFTTETKLAAGSETLYIGLGGRVSATEADVLTPISAATLAELRCYASVSTGGSGIAVTLGSGACTSTLDYSTSTPPTVTVTSTTAQADGSGSRAVTAGQCVALKAVKSSTTTAAFVNCSLAKTANS